VEELATRPVGYQPENRPPYQMLVPLMEILAEALGVGVSSQKVQNEYNNLTENFGSEFKILLAVSLEEVAKTAGERVAEGIEKVREGEIVVEPGYDGVFGTVKIWPFDGERSRTAQGKAKQKQMSLF
ncbi:DNA helicase UvrD, partial [Candidatus Shapirobacteria bacterium CG10_big_fil_rev_8_21_14_0_10_38_14]